MTVANSEPAGLGHNKPPEPTLPERLAETHAPALAKLDALAERANKAPKDIVTDADLATVSDIAADANAEWKALEAERIREKKPYLDGQREVDGFFRDPLARANRIEAALTQRVTLFNRAKKKREDDAKAEAERMAREAADAAAKAAETAAAAGRVEDAMAELETAHAAAAKADEIATAPASEPAPIRTMSGVTINTNVKWTFEITDLAKVDLEALRPFLKPEAIEAAIRAFVRINKGGRQITGVRIFPDEIAVIRK